MTGRPLRTPIGPLTLVADGGALREIRFEDDDRRPVADGSAAGHPEADLLAEVAGQLRAYFEGTRRVFELPLGPRGTPFQLRVWEELATLPFGATTSYGELARRLGRPGAARAVGLANGANPLPIVLPCHRVIGANGDLTGYGGGLDRKRWLLAHERVRGIEPPPRLF